LDYYQINVAPYYVSFSNAAFSLWWCCPSVRWTAFHKHVYFLVVLFLPILTPFAFLLHRLLLRCPRSIILRSYACVLYCNSSIARAYIRVGGCCYRIRRYATLSVCRRFRRTWARAALLGHSPVALSMNNSIALCVLPPPSLGALFLFMYSSLIFPFTFRLFAHLRGHFVHYYYYYRYYSYSERYQIILIALTHCTLLTIITNIRAFCAVPCCLIIHWCRAWVFSILCGSIIPNRSDCYSVTGYSQPGCLRASWFCQPAIPCVCACRLRFVDYSVGLPGLVVV